MSVPILTIVRGLPGSGKSTYARKLADDTGAMVIEPDALLVFGGAYHYTPDRYIMACDTAGWLAWHLGQQGIDMIYADVLPTKDDVLKVRNTVWDEVPTDKRHAIVVHDMPLLTVDESMARNRHAVRREDIERMATDWEPWEGSHES